MSDTHVDAPAVGTAIVAAVAWGATFALAAIVARRSMARLERHQAETLRLVLSEVYTQGRVDTMVQRGHLRRIR